MGFFEKLKKNDVPVQSQEQPSAPAGRQDKIIDLKKKAGIVLEKKNIAGVRAAVYLVLDYSGSMRKFYKNSSVQDFTEKVLGISANLDDDGTVPVVLFDSSARNPVNVSVNNYHGAIDRMVASAGHMGTTNYADAMNKIIELHKGNPEPAFVIFQTDGSPDNRTNAEKTLCAAANLPIFWQFVGFGDDEFKFLRKLDELSVPQKRVIDNAGFFTAGNNPSGIPTEELYDKLLSEFPDWLMNAKRQGIVR